MPMTSLARRLGGLSIIRLQALVDERRVDERQVEARSLPVAWLIAAVAAASFCLLLSFSI